MASEQDKRMAKDQSGPRESTHWWQQGRSWLMGTIALGITAGLTDLVKQVVTGGAPALSELLSWLWEAQPLPRLVGILAVAVVAGAAVSGVVRLWPRPKPAPTPDAPPSANASFRGGIYHDRPWSWTSFTQNGNPYRPQPHCDRDGTQFRLQYQDSHRRDLWVCPDCKQCLDPHQISEPDDVALLAGRDITNGHWQEAQRAFATQMQQLAAGARAKSLAIPHSQ